MALSIDTRSVLRIISDHLDAFPAIQPDLPEIVRKLLLKQLKAKSTDIGLLRKLSEILGSDTIQLIFDGMTETELAGLIKRVDPHSPYGKAGGDAGAARLHIADLAAGRVALTGKPVKAPTPKKPKTARKEPVSKIGEVLGSEVHSGAPRQSRKKS